MAMAGEVRPVTCLLGQAYLKDFFVLLLDILKRNLNPFGKKFLYSFRDNPMERLTAAKHRASGPNRRVVKPTDEVRRRALARMYVRRSALRDLIGALERYQLEQGRQRAKCEGFTGEETSS
jgi:hypothetical protein